MFLLAVLGLLGEGEACASNIPDRKDPKGASLGLDTSYAASGLFFLAVVLAVRVLAVAIVLPCPSYYSTLSRC